MTDEIDILHDLISEVSQESSFAGWLTGIEFEIWDIMEGASPELGNITLSQDRIQRLRELSEAVGGWLVFRDVLLFVPLSAWNRLFERYRHGESISAILDNVDDIPGAIRLT